MIHTRVKTLMDCALEKERIGTEDLSALMILSPFENNIKSNNDRYVSLILCNTFLNIVTEFSPV